MHTGARRCGGADACPDERCHIQCHRRADSKMKYPTLAASEVRARISHAQLESDTESWVGSRAYV